MHFGFLASERTILEENVPYAELEMVAAIGTDTRPRTAIREVAIPEHDLLYVRTTVLRIAIERRDVDGRSSPIARDVVEGYVPYRTLSHTDTDHRRRGAQMAVTNAYVFSD